MRHQVWKIGSHADAVRVVMAEGRYPLIGKRFSHLDHWWPTWGSQNRAPTSSAQWRRLAPPGR